MGADNTRNPAAPPLPAPTETELTSLAPTDLASDVSRLADDKSSYSLPEDGTPVTIRTRSHKPNRSRTSLLIEYYEGGKPSSSSTKSSEQRKPSVRVRLTPSRKRKNGSSRDHIQITESKPRKASLSRHSTTPTGSTADQHVEGDARSALGAGDMEDLSSYASATEESNVSRNPIDIEIDRGHPRRRRPASPLIPTADNSLVGSQQPAASDISAFPTDSFFDGPDPTSARTSDVKRSRSRSPSRAGDYLAGAAAGLVASAATEKLRTKSRDRDRERSGLSKSRDKDRSERKSKSGKSRSASGSGDKDRHAERSKSSRRRSSGGHNDSLVSGTGSSVASNLSPNHRLADQQSLHSLTSKASSINNPKLLETVEDVIRRLILPELNALKREQSKHKSDRDSAASSTTSLARSERLDDRRRSAPGGKLPETPREVLKRERRDREARNDFNYTPPPSGPIHDLAEDSLADVDGTPKHSGDGLRAAAAGAAAGAIAAAAAMGAGSPSEEKRSRRRRRAELRNRSSDHVADDYTGPEDLAPPPMPLMSEINPSDMTRTSILSADTDRPRSASEELTPVQEAARRGQFGEASTPTPSASPATVQAGLGMQHANVSHGDLKELPRRRAGDLFSDENFDAASYGRKMPEYTDRHFDDEGDYGHGGQDMAYGDYDYYNTQDVPPPLRYQPYQPENRGLSPIQSVSGYTEGGSDAPNRDSRAIHASDSISSLDRSPRRDTATHSPSSVQSNAMSKGSRDESSLRTHERSYRKTAYTEDSEPEGPPSGQAVRGVGANPELVHPPVILESNVASLIDPSMLDESVLTGGSSRGGKRMDSLQPFVEEYLEEGRQGGRSSPAKPSVEERGGTPASGSLRSRDFAEEYEVDDYGNKVPRSRYRQSPTASEAAITVPAAIAAAAALKAAQGRGQDGAQSADDNVEVFTTAGVQRNRSFKERAMDSHGPLTSPAHTSDGLMDDHEQPKMGFHAMPDPEHPMPELGNWHEEDVASVQSSQQQARDDGWPGDATPRQPSPLQEEIGQGGYHDDRSVQSIHDEDASHSRQPSPEQDQDQDEEWHRTSDDRKRDTLLTNPYEGASPIVNLPGLNDNLLAGGQNFGGSEFNDGYTANSPLGHKIDEGYISQGPNRTPDMQSIKGKGAELGRRSLNQEDPFYAPNHARDISGLSQGMASPFYDASTGTGIDRIESKDIIALMQHLTVRDAQRSARDTEILVTLVRSATEMRNSFEDIKRLLADTEDVIITEVKDNTEKTVQRAIGGPRPFPGSAPRSSQGGSRPTTLNGDDIPAKKRNLFQRALKGLSTKGTNDLGRIEDMLMQLLTEVDLLKAQTTSAGISTSHQDAQSFDNTQPDVSYEQDRGYEPEGMAGTSTTSHASQSGHLSNPQSRGASIKLGYEHKFADHRISTVPEANEEDYGYDGGDPMYNGNPGMLMTPAPGAQRGSSVPLGSPPQTTAAPTQASLSNENTPRTEKGKKHKSTGSSGWFPKISRWSETTTSSVAQAFKRGGQSRKSDEAGNRPSTSRSWSDNAPYDDNYSRTDPYGDDKLHSGFSEADLAQQHGSSGAHGNPVYQSLQQLQQQELQQQQHILQPPAALGYLSLTPEDPKYKVHRNSLNLQHPQPRSGQSELFKATLESQAQNYNSPRSPRSADWASSATSLQRPPRSADGDSYGSPPQQAGSHQRYWPSSPGGGNAGAAAGPSGPPRPPKEPLDHAASPRAMASATSLRSDRTDASRKQSPLSYQGAESGYGATMHGALNAGYDGHSPIQSPRLENRNLSSALGVPARRPTGPRAMTPRNVAGDDGDADRRRKRDTFGSIGSPDTDTF